MSALTIMSAANIEAKAEFNQADIISEQPEGEVHTFTRSGFAFSTIYGSVRQFKQEGTKIEIVYDADGTTVYLKDIISQLKVNTWVKGSIEGDKLHVPMNQLLYYYDDLGYGLFLGKGDIYEAGVNDYGWEYNADATEMTFTITGDGMMYLDGTDSGVYPYGQSLMAAFFTVDNTWTGYGDYESVFCEVTDIPNEQPDDLETEEWVFQSDKSDGYKVEVGIKDGKMYISRLSSHKYYVPIIGTIQDDKVVFESDQFLGFTTGSGYAIYFYGALYNPEEETITYQPELVFDYDASTKTLTSANPNNVLVFGSGKGSEEINYFEIYLNPSFQGICRMAAIPETPTIERYEDYWGFFYAFEFRTRNYGTNGEYIDPLDMEWAVYVDDQIKEFTPEEGYHVREPRTWFNYYFVDYEGGTDFYFNGNHVVNFIDYDFTTLGAQSRFTFEGETYYSDIRCVNVLTNEQYTIEVEHTGIRNLATEQFIARVFDLGGRPVEHTQKGFVVRDGKLTFVK